jgi:hypothetical protein
VNTLCLLAALTGYYPLPDDVPPEPKWVVRCTKDNPYRFPIQPQHGELILKPTRLEYYQWQFDKSDGFRVYFDIHAKELVDE